MLNHARNHVVIKILRSNFCYITKRNIQTHYDILGVSRNSTTKEIRDAYIKLSKQYHPDKSSEVNTEKQFVKVLAAYNILSKSSSRKHYDWELSQGFFDTSNSYRTYQQDPQSDSRAKGYGYDDPSFWVNRKKTDYRDGPYYGIRGIQRVPNGIIAVICVAICVIGTTLQYFAIRHSFTLKRDVLKQRSDDNEALLAELKSDAAKSSKELQIKLIKQRLLNNKTYDTKDL